jgi:peptidoglycan/xylan/chitin deacetylase (PgdA/CDA1 family)
MTTGPAVSRSIALTFDDGPDPVHTPLALDRLRANGIRATFFLIGERVEAHPKLLGRILEEGHHVGHHSYTHGKPHLTSARQLMQEVRRTAVAVERLGGGSLNLCRPPHGKVTVAKLLGLWSLRQTVVLWNRDPKDYSRTPAELRRWVEDQPMLAGDIFLLHDIHGGVGAAVDALAERAAARGLRCSTPREWLDG